jgi:hypothetical protein
MKCHEYRGEWSGPSLQGFLTAGEILFAEPGCEITLFRGDEDHMAGDQERYPKNGFEGLPPALVSGAGCQGVPFRRRLIFSRAASRRLRSGSLRACSRQAESRAAHCASTSAASLR